MAVLVVVVAIATPGVLVYRGKVILEEAGAVFVAAVAVAQAD
jgi:hypothetical protein